MSHQWLHMEESNTYIGDMMTQNGVRKVLVVSKGVAVWATCPIEKHAFFLDDFLTLAPTVAFTFAAKLENGIPAFDDSCEESFDTDTLGDIHQHLVASLALTGDHDA